ncbi:MAG: hypothetical protein INF91_08610 [Alphaproteobacteria bacterium]|nr:hypothetical protein [Alphaproteobacteria bacterium]
MDQAAVVDPPCAGTAGHHLGPIRGVTFAVRDLDAMVAAYERYLGFSIIDTGLVSADFAAACDAPRAAGSRYAILAIEGVASWLRFIERPDQPAVPALTTWGWNATEILVENPDATVARLTRGPFRLIGEPRSLTRFPMIRAAQLLGLEGECLYVTDTGTGHGLDLARASRPVDRVFIAVAGGPDLEAMVDVYAGFGNAYDPPVSTPVRVLSLANGLDSETPHAHALVTLGEGTHVELDAYPAMCGPRPTPPGDLPPGMAIVSFGGQVDGVSHRSPIGGAAVAAAMRRGAAGELIEIMGDAR